MIKKSMVVVLIMVLLQNMNIFTWCDHSAADGIADDSYSTRRRKEEARVEEEIKDVNRRLAVVNSSEYMIVPAGAILGGFALIAWQSLTNSQNEKLLYFAGGITLLACGYGAVEAYSKRAERKELENEKKELKKQLNN